MPRILIASLATLWAAQQAPAPERAPSLKDVRTWMFQFQKLDAPDAVSTLAKSAYDLMVVEPMGTYRSGKAFDMKGMVGALRAGRKGRIVLAYLDLAEADSNRSYWQKHWTAPSANQPGSPDFLLKPDPDGWKDTYLVCYSDPRWRELLQADVALLLNAGFDGLYLDWVGAYEDDTVAARIKASGRDPAGEMVELLARVRTQATQLRPGALILIQNAPYLLDADPRVLPLVDGAAFENTWYSGAAEADWGDKAGGDRPNHSSDPRRSTEALLVQYQKWRAADKPVFTLDYCLRPEHSAEVYTAALQHGLVPLVSRSALDQPTATPPPGLTPRKP